MNHNVDALMQEAFNMNPIIQMWLKVQSSPLLILELNEYMKIVEIVRCKYWVQWKMRGP